MKSLAVVVGLALCGCHGSPSSPSGANGEVTANDDLDHRPIIALAIWPEHWASIVSSAQRFAPLRDNPLLVGSTMWSALAQLAATAQFGTLSLPPPGVDANAPISFELFGATDSFEVTALSAARAISAGKPFDRPPAVRLRVTIQARDPKAAGDALRTELRSQRGTSVAVGASAVAIDVLIGGAHPAMPADLPAPTAPSSAFDANRPSAGRFVAHFDRLSNIATTIGMARMLDALGEVPTDQKLSLLAEGAGELFTVYLFVDPATAFATDVMIDVPAEPGPPRIAFALGDAGKKTMTAAGLVPGKSVRLAELQWSAALAATPRSPFFTATLDPSGKLAATNLAMLVHECGPVCLFYAGLGDGFELASWLHVDLDEVIAGASDNLGVDASALRAVVASWSQGDLLFLHADGASLPLWKRPALRPTNASEACYRGVAIAVRASVKADDATPPKAPLDGIELDKAAACVASDPAIAARFQATSDLAAAVRRR